MALLDNKTYLIQPTKQGIYIILIRARSEESERACVMYDGRENALFLRTPGETILLDYVPVQIRQNLLSAPKVAIMELDFINEAVVRSYFVPVRAVDEIYVAKYRTVYSFS